VRIHINSADSQPCPLRSALERGRLLFCTFFIVGNQQMFAQPTLAIPEPGYAMYGTLTNAGAQATPPTLSVSWRIVSGGETVTNLATLVNVNGQSFYLALVPFETRSIPGLAPLPATPNTLELLPTGAAYTRSATVNGTAATLIGPASFTFGPADRGRVDRVDLLVNLPPATFAQWLASYGLPTNSLPTADPTGKGMTLWDDFIAGTNPTNAASLFQMQTNVKPLLQGGQFAGITIQWDSVAGKTYTVYRSLNLGQTFQPVQTNVAATVPLNSFSDGTATGPGPYFYRIQVHP